MSYNNIKKADKVNSAVQGLKALLNKAKNLVAKKKIEAGPGPRVADNELGLTFGGPTAAASGTYTQIPGVGSNTGGISFGNSVPTKSVPAVKNAPTAPRGQKGVGLYGKDVGYDLRNSPGISVSGPTANTTGVRGATRGSSLKADPSPGFFKKHRNAVIGTGVGLGATGTGAAMLMGGKDSPVAAPNVASPAAGAASGLSLTPGSLGAGLADMLPLEARNYLQQTLGNDGYVRALRGLAGAGVGAGLGLGVGALGHMIGPKKKNRQSLLRSALYGALTGGSMGAIDPIYNAVSGAMGGKANAS